MELKELINRAKIVRDKYAKVETEVSGKPWGVRERMEGFVGDVGDLMKFVMAKKGLRKIDDIDEKLAHELSDCLWSVFIIADELGIDIENKFIKTLDELEKELKNKIWKITNYLR